MNQSNEPQKTPRIYPVEPDKELLVWEKWITIRKEEAMKLAKQTKRSPADLVINLVQDVREDKERKIVLEDAQIEEKVGVRDTLWDQPHRLKQRCYCDPVYEIHRTPAQMGQPPLIEHIGVPKDIQKTEMGVIVTLNEQVKRVGRSKLYLQNLGTVTLRYCWKKIKKPIPFIPEDTYDQVFFFNKNEDVLPPGQDKEIFFTFISDKPVNDVVDKATVTTPQIYPYKKYFLEAELFVMKNPYASIIRRK
ncbi:hypothetical protein MSG28_003007 [Choristoneura fumiferana]|uniref:Uncharacterized protein n=1 Tax=Choristoneura fumiferana TaxID=7141 RepID=A0ACC0JK91_CHOFU|nr:hypothetical protein MSG28_003007 [Choristoneura fumiferana]